MAALNNRHYSTLPCALIFVALSHSVHYTQPCTISVPPQFIYRVMRLGLLHSCCCCCVFFIPRAQRERAKDRPKGRVHYTADHRIAYYFIPQHALCSKKQLSPIFGLHPLRISESGNWSNIILLVLLCPSLLSPTTD